MRLLCFLITFVCICGANEIIDMESMLKHNEKLKQLEYEIKALEAKAKLDRKWDNPRLKFGYDNAEVLMPHILDASEMQNIFIGISQGIDLNGKRKLSGKITDKQATSKLYELKNLRNEYAFRIISGFIDTKKNNEILDCMNDSIKNIDILLDSLKTSSNFNPMQIQKLRTLKAKLEIRKNDIANGLKNANIEVSEISFGESNILNISYPSSEELDKVEESSFINNILAHNYEIKSALLNDEISRDSITLARKSYIPDLEVGFRYMFRVNRTDMFSLDFSLPLGIYGREKYAILQNKYENLVAKSKALDVENKIKHNAYNLIANLKTYRKNLEIIDSMLLPSNTQITSLYKHHSTSQVGAFLEFYSALNDEIEAKILRIETLAQISKTYWNLQSLRGIYD